MTNEEAIKLIRSQRGWYQHSNDDIARLFGYAIELGADALEKQIAKKTVKVNGREICPCCGTSVASPHLFVGYHDCGQKIER